MISEAMPTADRAYVWVWLPGAVAPVVAGLLRRDRHGGYGFAYGRSYLGRDDAISLFPDELPLQPGEQRQPDDDLPSCLRDASPDAWGRRVIVNRLTGQQGAAAAGVELDELTYLLESGSDRIGALDFQASPSVYRPREAEHEDRLDDLLDAAEHLERGEPLSPALALALQHGTSIGGARPKALLTSPAGKFIAKFSTSTDLYNLVKAEYLACAWRTEPARALIDAQIAVMLRDWDRVCDEAGLTLTQRRLFWRRQFLNPYCLEGYPVGIAIPDPG